LGCPCRILHDGRLHRSTVAAKQTSVHAKYRKLSATEQAPETSIERYEAAADCPDCGGNSCIGYVVCREPMVVAELFESGPLATDFRHFNAGYRKQRVNEFNRLTDRNWIHKDPPVGCQAQKSSSDHWQKFDTAASLASTKCAQMSSTARRSGFELSRGWN
jgi:hypothetical protein